MAFSNNFWYYGRTLAHEPKTSFVWLNSVFVRSGPKMLPEVKHFRKFFTDFNKQGFKWKLITSPSYIEKKLNILPKFEVFTKKCIFLCQVFFILFSVNIYVQFQKTRSQMKCYDTHYLFNKKNLRKLTNKLNDKMPRAFKICPEFIW